MTIIDLSGLTFSGKTSVSNLLSEFDNVYTPNYLLEFDLLRLPNGLIDLNQAINNWSPMRCYSAFRRFDKLIDKLYRKPHGMYRIFQNGWNYQRFYPDLLVEKTKFIKGIIETSWKTPWPYSDLEDNLYGIIKSKIYRKLQLSHNRDFFLINKSIFLREANIFVENVIKSQSVKDFDFYVTHNALEPFNPELNIKLLGKNAKAIIVTRDPRDIFINSATQDAFFNKSLKDNIRITGAFDVKTFVARQKTYLSNINPNSSKDILYLKFEDIVMEYEKSLDKIIRFIGLSNNKHNYKFKYFKPEESKKNIHMWKQNKFKNFKNEIQYIKNSLNLHDD